MKRSGAAVLAVMGALGLGAIVASSAIAAQYPITALPQLGRCVKGPKGSEWANSHCQYHIPGKGRFNWLEGAGAKNKFTGLSEITRLDSGNPKHLIQCATTEYSGEYTGAKTENVTLLLVGCTRPEVPGQRCESSPVPQREGEIEFTTGGELGFVSALKGKKKPVAGWDLKKVEATITCGAPPENPTTFLTDKIEGSVIGTVKRTESMFTEETLTFSEAGGKQKPEQFEGGPKDVLTSQFVDSGGPSTEQVGLLETAVIENEEPLEIKAQCVEKVSEKLVPCK